MSDTDIRIREIIAQELGLPLSAVVPGARLREDLGVGPEDRDYLVCEVEHHLVVSLYGPARTPVTVGHLIRAVDAERANFGGRR